MSYIDTSASKSGRGGLRLRFRLRLSSERFGTERGVCIENREKNHPYEKGTRLAKNMKKRIYLLPRQKIPIFLIVLPYINHMFPRI